jgi:DNA-binding NtrC family response regulator
MMPATEVLVIDDDALDRELIAELLAVRGRGQVRVAQAPDLRGAMHWMGQRTFDLVLLDTRLADATALYALRVIGEQAPTTPVLPHPSYITARARQTARERGALDVVVRGDLNPLWAAVNKLLTLRALSHEDRPHAVGE